MPDRRGYSLSPDQPILRQARRHRKSRTQRPEIRDADFWKSFSLEKFARNWREELEKAAPRAVRLP